MIQELEKLLGEKTFFVPCEPGTKVPLCCYVNRDFEETQSTPYRSLLEESNVAVYLGDASDGLCAIDFDADEDLEAFLAINNGIAKSLRTRGARGAQVWVRIKGSIPESMTCAHFEWRANKRLSTIAGVHPSGCEYKRLVDAPPKVVEFSEIKWPEGWPVPGADGRENELVQKYGEPWTAAKGGAPSRLNQRFFAALFVEKNRVLWDPSSSRFWEYEAKNGRWHLRTDEEVTDRAAHCTGEFVNEVAKNAGNEFSEAIRTGHVQNHSNFQRGLVSMLKGMSLERDRFKVRSGIVHTGNGVIDLTHRPYSFQEFNPDVYSRNQIPIDYRPGAECPRFINELLRPQLDDEDQRLLQCWCGQAILQRNLHQVFLILTGTPRGGKGTIARLINRMIGECNVHQLRTKHLTERFEIGLFHGRTLLYGADVPPDFLSNEGAHMIKSLTGGDLMTGEVKGSMSSFTVKGEFNLLVTCNSRLMFKIQGDAGAWARRMLWIQFEAPPTDNPVPNFDEELIECEGSGILNWMLEGASAVLDAARARQAFPVTAKQRERIQNLLSESDSVRECIRARVKRSSFPADHITSEGLFTVYLEMCEERGWQPLAQRTFLLRADEILTMELRAVKGNHFGENRGKKGWAGVVIGEGEVIDQPW
jgi:P4 family phage/plasmid primase-like protien